MNDNHVDMTPLERLCHHKAKRMVNKNLENIATVSEVGKFTDLLDKCISPDDYGEVIFTHPKESMTFLYQMYYDYSIKKLSEARDDSWLDKNIKEALDDN